MLFKSCGIVCKLSQPHVKPDFLLEFPLLGSVNFSKIGIVVTKSDSCLFGVVPVIAHTEPTKLVFAVVASHVHASLIFLNGRLAFWTELGVDLHPKLRAIAGTILVTLPKLIHEHLPVVAFDRDMGILFSIEAECFSTFSKDIDCCELRVINSFVTARRWTPLDSLVAVHIVVHIVLLVRLVFVWLED